jgi:NADH-quinone oxidoreductase subunit N
MTNELFILMKQELLVTVILFIILFLKLGSREWKTESLLNLVNVLLLLQVAAGFFWNRNGELFGGMYRTNELLSFEKNILSLGTLIISLQSYNWLRTHKHASEFYLLLLSSLLGMFLLISSNHLLLFYLALELSTIPLAALVNFDLERKQSSEAAFKMIISSAFSSGLLLFGISLLYGATGNLNLSTLPGLLQGKPLELFAFVLILAGFGFKISAVPFHLWTADVYEGAPVPVTSYLSVISKGAVLFAFVSILYNTFGGLGNSWYNMLFLLSVATMLIGNLFALRQQNIKRFLAFSSVAQVGFILIGISGQSLEGSASLIYFVMVYLFSNLAAFGVIGVVSAATGKETINDYKGFYKTNPLLSWILALGLFSLAGIPPTAGFFGKFFLLMAGAAKGNYLLLVIAALNMVISLYYYLRIIKAMFMDANEEPIETIQLKWSPRLALMLCVGGILITGLFSGAYHYIYSLLVLYS